MYPLSIMCLLFFVLTEKWLTDNFLYREFGLSNYVVYRCDGSSLTSTCLRGGGVHIDIRKDIPSFLNSTSFVLM